ncbi:hypothetical protein K7957_05530 [Sphingomonas yunnanensis]|uniref:hypothetical protein n=1 Tax=Sphingomonas yunnanensis TaxID=310400 RepID=UPI001CA758BC|nr:hypothetical protein [Sphingomonas yunnanensis]MBY9062391.1 hypothetical protein [Sphingomonas yunnanensis]
MLFTTSTQYIALAVALIAGWLFGLASHPGGGKWKTRYAAERDAHAATAKRVAELERDHARLAELERDNARIGDLERENARVAELERENERLRAAPPAMDERVVRDERPILGDRPTFDERVVRDERAFRDEAVVPRSSAAPAHPTDRRII